MLTTLTGPAAVYFDTVNTPDPAAFADSFAENALLMDAGQVYEGLAAIRKWSEIHIFAAGVQYEVTKVIHNLENVYSQDEVIVTAKVDGNYDKTGLPDPLLLDHHFRLEDGKIIQLTIR